ncbi:MAG: SpvB/TcaC N-terminal domain-containing protein, partial [Candidatus Omnitrophota bacterium]
MSNLFLYSFLHSRITKVLSILLSTTLIFSQLELSALAKETPKQISNIKNQKESHPKASNRIQSSSNNSPDSPSLIKRGSGGVDVGTPETPDVPEIPQDPEQPQPKQAISPDGTSPADAGVSFGSGPAVIQSVQNDPFTGRLSLSVPIVVPPGRRGIQPKLSLNYTSNQANSSCG